MDYTGTGNSLNMRHPHVLQLIMDSLRYWIVEMHVDGFRFDLAATLARELHDVDRLSAFFDIIQQDPVISQVKLIAEPWDVGEGGYQIGNFPPRWCEWNSKYRDSIRDYWRGAERTVGDFANRLTGSADLYENTGRRPYASINFVTAHVGFTLLDLVSYDHKHNEANGEDNRDGERDNRSWNYGVEGPSDDPAVVALRNRQKRNMLATLFVSQGIPMLLAGDELGRTQHGNYTAYFQDNDLSWIDWESVDESLLAFTARLIAFRREHPVFRRRRWFAGKPLQGSARSDIGWFNAEGELMSVREWESGSNRALAVFVDGEGIPSRGRRGERIIDDTFYVMFNAHEDPWAFVLPDENWGRQWRVALTTTDDEPASHPELAARATLTLPDRSLAILKRLP
jgi:glycogen operon protein